jgi:alkanesulfonate monooxygenase SsuD/methylene tetrahydromethanopterin reductase-like flavin-dependent oxidoreductase (luciferase family)
MKLGLTVTPEEPRDVLLKLARDIEDGGFHTIYTPEVNNDSLSHSLDLAAATSRIGIGTWVTNIYLRAAPITATSAAIIQEVSQGRFTLGLGISHAPVLAAFGLKQGPDPRADMTAYVDAIRRTWNGELTVFGHRFRPPTEAIPIHLGVMVLEAARHAAQVAEGALLLCCTPQRYHLATQAGEKAASEAGHDRGFAAKLGIPVFIDDDLDEAYAKARRSTSTYLLIPNYRRMFAASGFEEEVNAAEKALAANDQDAVLAAASDRLLDSVCLIGPASRCRERLSVFCDAGVESAILVPGPNSYDMPTWVRRVIKTFRDLN